MARHTLQIDQNQIHQAKGDFLVRFGHAMAEWSSVERGLYYWFQQITGMKDPLCRGIFYGAKGFGTRVDMLETAIAFNETYNAEEIAFIKDAIKKARTYSSFRNQLAHGELLHVYSGPPPAPMKIALVHGKDTTKEPQIWVDDVETSAANFRELFDIISDFSMRRSHAGIVQRCLARLAQLPTQANEKAAPIPPEPHEPTAPRRVNKKAHRAAKKARL